METKTCNKCSIEKDVTSFSLGPTYKGKRYLRGECKACQVAYNMTPEQRVKAKEWEKANKDKRLAAKRTEAYRAKIRERYSNDLLYRLKCVVRSRVNLSFKVKCIYKSTSSIKYLGCNIPRLKRHVENQFLIGMSWDNYGDWEIDHIIPLASANNEVDMLKLAKYTNLQPLWKQDNRTKSDKMPA